MKLVKEITGETFGRLTVLHKTATKNGMMNWMCLCECGNKKEVSGNHLRTGHTRSCGCLLTEHAADLHNHVKPKPPSRKGERLYNIWKDMRSRCRGDEEHSRKYYASRGITICPEWDDYLNFKQWAMSQGYQDSLTIDRIDNNKGYRPDNCRWISMFEQASNKTTNRWITVNGVTKTLAQWARTINSTPSNVFSGLERNGTQYIQARLPGVYVWTEAAS